MTASHADRRALLTLLHEDAYAEREVTLASGQKSNIYVDCKQVTLSARGHHLVGRELFRLAKEFESEHGVTFGAVGGMSIGADPMCSALSLISYQEGSPLDAIYVRKEPKGHGTGAYLEGATRVEPGTNVLLVEDVVTTGGSALAAVERLREGGYTVETIFGLVDRNAGGREKMREAGCTLQTLFTLDEVVSGTPAER